MRQFDVLRNPDAEAARFAPYLVVLQHDQLDVVPTVIVAPLVRVSVFPGITRLQPEICLSGEDYVLSLTDLTAVLRNMLTDKPVGSVKEQRDVIIRGLDLLFTGF